MTYPAQAPGAHLIHRIRQQISILLFEDRHAAMESLLSGAIQALSFQAESWVQDGLRYFVIGQVATGDIADWASCCTIENRPSSYFLPR